MFTLYLRRRLLVYECISFLSLQNSSILSMFPDIGPLSGGTSITINGKGLDIGRERIVRIDNKTCAVNARRFDSNHFN